MGLEDMVVIITMRSLILSTSSMEFMMTSITQTLVKKGLVMKLVISRESIMYTVLMATMVVLSCRSNMMEKYIILMLFIMGVMDTLVVAIYNQKPKSINEYLTTV